MARRLFGRVRVDAVDANEDRDVTLVGHLLVNPGPVGGRAADCGCGCAQEWQDVARIEPVEKVIRPGELGVTLHRAL